MERSRVRSPLRPGHDLSGQVRTSPDSPVSLKNDRRSSSLNFTTLDALSTEQPTVILGDFNEDLCKPNPKIKQFLQDRGFNQFTSESTSDSSSIIDHTYFNKNVSKVEGKVIDTFYSDHDLTCLLFPMH